MNWVLSWLVSLWLFLAFGCLQQSQSQDDFDSMSTDPHPLQSSVDKMLWMTEDYPPYHYIENGVIRGKAIKIIDELFQRNQVSFVSNERVLVYPWARAFSELTNNPDAAIITMAHTDKRDKQFILSEPVFTERIALITKTQNDINLSQLEDVHKFVVGVVRDDIGETLVKNLAFTKLQLSPVLSSDELLQMLLKDRVDLIAYSVDIIEYQLTKRGLDKEEFNIIHILQELPTSIAFNRNTDQAIVTLFDRSIRAMKKDGTIDKILNETVDISPKIK